MNIPLLSQLGFITHFVVNKKYVIANYCVNKEAPELKCDGKCHLRNFVQIQQEEQPTEEVPQLPISSLQKLFSLVLFIDFSTSPNFRREFLSDASYHHPIDSPYATKHLGREHQHKLVKPPSA